MKFQYEKHVQSRPLYNPVPGTVAVPDIIRRLKNAGDPSDHEINNLSPARALADDVNFRLHRVSQFVLGLMFLAVELKVCARNEADLFATPWVRGMGIRENRKDSGALGRGWFGPDNKLLYVRSKIRKKGEIMKVYRGDDDDENTPVSELDTYGKLCAHPNFEAWLIRVMFAGVRNEAATKALAVATGLVNGGNARFPPIPPPLDVVNQQYAAPGGLMVEEEDENEGQNVEELGGQEHAQAVADNPGRMEEAREIIEISDDEDEDPNQRRVEQAPSLKRKANELEDNEATNGIYADAEEIRERQHRRLVDSNVRGIQQRAEELLRESIKLRAEAEHMAAEEADRRRLYEIEHRHRRY